MLWMMCNRLVLVCLEDFCDLELFQFGLSDETLHDWMSIMDCLWMKPGIMFLNSS